MLAYLREVGYSLYSVIKGLKVTDANRRRAETTLLYPEERPKLAPRFRGFPEVDMNLCIVCHLCEKACPTQCIHIEEKLNKPAHGEAEGGEKPAAKKKKEATVFDINSALCMVCGLCEEACPTKPKSIVLGHNFEVAKSERQALVYGITEDRVNAPANPPVPRGKR